MARKPEERSLVRPPEQKLHIFLSYASEDKQLVAGIASELKAAFPFSLEVHRDEDFKLGDNWKEDIEDGLDKTDILLVIFTDGRSRAFHSRAMKLDISTVR